jgi:hypothetical protein
MSGSFAKPLLAVLAAGAIALSSPAWAQSAQPAKSEKSEKKAAKSEAKSEAKSDDKGKGTKQLSAQQQKMKDCGAKWQDEKKAKGVSGKAAYQKFLSGCLKG